MPSNVGFDVSYSKKPNGEWGCPDTFRCPLAKGYHNAGGSRVSYTFNAWSDNANTRGLKRSPTESPVIHCGRGGNYNASYITNYPVTHNSGNNGTTVRLAGNVFDVPYSDIVASSLNGRPGTEPHRWYHFWSP